MNHDLVEHLRIHDQFEFVITPEDKRCEAAKQFEEWIQQYCLTGLKKADALTILQNKNDLTDSYMQRRRDVSKSHRDHVTERGHTCIFHIFERYYRQLRAAELSLKPIPLSELVKPSSPVISEPPPPIVTDVFVKAK